MVSPGEDGSVLRGSRRFGGPIQFRDIWPVLREELQRELPPGAVPAEADPRPSALPRAA